jgi:FKBP12-rapamycin complex-associated protein
MLLSACLDILKTREKSPGDTYRRIFEEAKSGLLKASSTDTILGSLLAFSSMLQNQQIVSRALHSSMGCQTTPHRRPY